MDKLYKNIEKELKQIEENGLNASNIDNAYKLADIAKNILKIQKMREGKDEMRDRYMEPYRGGYRDDDYRNNPYDYYDGRYDRRPPSGRERDRDGRYREGDRWHDYLNKIMDGADIYEYGRGRYLDSGDNERMYEGLEKLMHALCMFVESTMDFAQSPEEKEIIRKHLQQMKSL